MKSTAKTVDEYVKSLPEDRREAISAVRKVILKNLPKGYEECEERAVFDSRDWRMFLWKSLAN